VKNGRSGGKLDINTVEQDLREVWTDKGEPNLRNAVSNLLQSGVFFRKSLANKDATY